MNALYAYVPTHGLHTHTRAFTLFSLPLLHTPQHHAPPPHTLFGCCHTHTHVAFAVGLPYTGYVPRCHTRLFSRFLTPTYRLRCYQLFTVYYIRWIPWTHTLRCRVRCTLPLLHIVLRGLPLPYVNTSHYTVCTLPVRLPFYHTLLATRLRTRLFITAVLPTTTPRF